MKIQGSTNKIMSFKKIFLLVSCLSSNVFAASGNDFNPILIVGPTVSNRGNGIEVNFSKFVNFGVSVYKLKDTWSNQDAARINIGYGAGLLQIGAVFVNEPSDYRAGIGPGTGYRIAMGSTLGHSQFTASLFAISVHGKRLTKNEFGAQIGYSF
jgi:hypothetical protein